MHFWNKDSSFYHKRKLKMISQDFAGASQRYLFITGRVIGKAPLFFFRNSRGLPKIKSLLQASIRRAKMVLRLQSFTVLDLQCSRTTSFKIISYFHINFPQFACKGDFNWWSSSLNSAGRKIVKNVNSDCDVWWHKPHLTCWFVLNGSGVAANLTLKNGNMSNIFRLWRVFPLPDIQSLVLLLLLQIVPIISPLGISLNESKAILDFLETQCREICGPREGTFPSLG